jgi:hypothetical protein
MKIYYLVLSIVLVAILVPIWIVDYPGMVDYPNHLARCYVLAHYHGNPLWQERYALVHEPIPNLAIELVVVPLLQILPLIVSGKMFLTLAAVLYVLGCTEIGRAVTGERSWLALVAAFTFYNSQLLYGFVNYVFGVSVFLCAFAFWLRVRNRMSPLRFLACCLLSICAYFAHLSAVAFLGIGCLIVSIIDFVRDRNLLSAIVKTAWLACPALIMAVFLKGSGQVGKIVWQPSLGHKLVLLLSPVRSYNIALDVTVIVTLVLCALVILKGAQVQPVVLVGFAFFVLFLLTPQVLFTSSAADARYVIPAYLFLILSIKPRNGRWQKAAIALALLAMFVRTGSIAANWLEINRRNERAISMGQILPQGARVYVLESDSLTEPSHKLDRGMGHAIEFWTVLHDAELSTFFAKPGQQPLLHRQPPCQGPDYKACFATYDYVWTYDPPADIRQTLLAMATPAEEWENVTLWRVNRPPYIRQGLVTR